MLTLKRKVKLECGVLPIKRFRQNWDYEVISFDEHGNEHEIPKLSLFAYRYSPKKDTTVHAENALRVHMGVIRILKGKNKGHELMFVLDHLDYVDANRLLVYGHLTYGYTDKRLVKRIYQDKVTLYDLTVLVYDDQKIYEEIIGHPYTGADLMD